MLDIPTSSFLAGAWVGLAVAAPIGPMGVLCIQRTLAHGIVAGLGTGLAAATVQASYGTMALLGLGPAMLAAAGASASVLSAASGAVLLWFAIRTARGTPQASTRMVTLRPGLARSFRDALALGFSNPMTVALFFAASPALVGNSNVLESLTVVGGIFTGVIGWYAALSGVVCCGRGWLSQRNVARTKSLSVAVLVAFAAYMFSRAL